MINACLFLILGFIFLIKGSDIFVGGSSSIAKVLNVPTLLIGLTIVAMGTSLPELAVSSVASFSGNNSLSVSNVVGSNIFNLLVVLGVTAFFSNLEVEKEVIKRDLPISIVGALIIAIVSFIMGSISRVLGIALLIAFFAYMVVIVKTAIMSRKNSGLGGEVKDFNTRPVWLSIIMIVVGIAAIKFGGDWVVDSAVYIATYFGVSETLIGLTIVSVGTSLPELVTSVVAARRNELEMAVGNAIGSNIFNIFLILGVASVISPIEIIKENTIDLAILILVSVISAVFCKSKSILEKKESIIMLILYVAYLAYIIIR